MMDTAFDFHDGAPHEAVTERRRGLSPRSQIVALLALGWVALVLVIAGAALTLVDFGDVGGKLVIIGMLLGVLSAGGACLRSGWRKTRAHGIASAQNAPRQSGRALVALAVISVVIVVALAKSGSGGGTAGSGNPGDDRGRAGYNAAVSACYAVLDPAVSDYQMALGYARTAASKNVRYTALEVTIEATSAYAEAGNSTQEAVGITELSDMCSRLHG